MSYTDEERAAIAKDITHGLKQVVAMLKQIEKSMPVAINRTNYSTHQRLMLKAQASLVETRQEFEAILKFEPRIKG